MKYNSIISNIKNAANDNNETMTVRWMDGAKMFVAQPTSVTAMSVRKNATEEELKKACDVLRKEFEDRMKVVLNVPEGKAYRPHKEKAEPIKRARFESRHCTIVLQNDGSWTVENDGPNPEREDETSLLKDYLKRHGHEGLWQTVTTVAFKGFDNESKTADVYERILLEIAEHGLRIPFKGSDGVNRVRDAVLLGKTYDENGDVVHTGGSGNGSKVGKLIVGSKDVVDAYHKFAPAYKLDVLKDGKRVLTFPKEEAANQYCLAMGKIVDYSLSDDTVLIVDPKTNAFIRELKCDPSTGVMELYEGVNEDTDHIDGNSSSFGGFNAAIVEEFGAKGLFARALHQKAGHLTLKGTKEDNGCVSFRDVCTWAGIDVEKVAVVDIVGRVWTFGGKKNGTYETKKRNSDGSLVYENGEVVYETKKYKTSRDLDNVEYILTPSVLKTAKLIKTQKDLKEFFKQWKEACDCKVLFHEKYYSVGEISAQQLCQFVDMKMEELGLLQAPAMSALDRFNEAPWEISQEFSKYIEKLPELMATRAVKDEAIKSFLYKLYERKEGRFVSYDDRRMCFPDFAAYLGIVLGLQEEDIPVSIDADCISGHGLKRGLVTVFRDPCTGFNAHPTACVDSRLCKELEDRLPDDVVFIGILKKKEGTDGEHVYHVVSGTANLSLNFDFDTDVVGMSNNRIVFENAKRNYLRMPIPRVLDIENKSKANEGTNQKAWAKSRRMAKYGSKVGIAAEKLFALTGSFWSGSDGDVIKMVWLEVVTQYYVDMAKHDPNGKLRLCTEVKNIIDSFQKKKEFNKRYGDNGRRLISALYAAEKRAISSNSRYTATQKERNLNACRTKYYTHGVPNVESEMLDEKFDNIHEIGCGIQNKNAVTFIVHRDKGELLMSSFDGKFYPDMLLLKEDNWENANIMLDVSNTVLMASDYYLERKYNPKMATPKQIWNAVQNIYRKKDDAIEEFAKFSNDEDEEFDSAQFKAQLRRDTIETLMNIMRLSGQERAFYNHIVATVFGSYDRDGNVSYCQTDNGIHMVWGSFKENQIENGVDSLLRFFGDYVLEAIDEHRISAPIEELC